MKKIKCWKCGKTFEVNEETKVLIWHTPPNTGLWGFYDTCSAVGSKLDMTKEEKISWNNRSREEKRRTNLVEYKKLFGQENK